MIFKVCCLPKFTVFFYDPFEEEGPARGSLEVTNFLEDTNPENSEINFQGLSPWRNLPGVLYGAVP